MWSQSKLQFIFFCCGLIFLPQLYCKKIGPVTGIFFFWRSPGLAKICNLHQIEIFNYTCIFQQGDFSPFFSTLHSSDQWIFHRIFPLNAISLENSPKPIWKCFVMDFVLPVYPTKYSRIVKKKWGAIVEFVSNLPCKNGKNVIFPLCIALLLFSSYGANAMTPAFWSQGKSGRRRTVCM